MKTEKVRAIVSKDSGGDATAAKLDAAAKLNIPVIMVARPAPPDGVTVCDNFDEIQKLILLAKRV